MRILLFLFTLLVSVSPLLAHSPLIPPIKIESAVRQNLLAPQKKAQETHKAAPSAEEMALQRLTNLQNPVNWKHISWQEFLKQNEHTKGVERVSTSLDIKCTEEFCALLPGPLPTHEFMAQENSEPDYKTLLTGQKLIFVAEEYNHNTKRAPQEMAKILQAVRKANPHAKILFATEFLTWDDDNNLPVLSEALQARASYEDYLKDLQETLFYFNDSLSEAQKKQYQQTIQEYSTVIQDITEWEKTSQATIKQTPLLKKARAKYNLSFYKEYAPAFLAADRFHIDQLALDDTIFGDDEDKVGVKVGEFVIEITPQDNVPFVIGKKKRNLTEEERLNNLLQVISVSPWGVRERNREWARRIEALMPLYDIVIVYAGAGHLDTTYFMDLQPMLKQENFVNIQLYPLEDLPEETEECYTQRYQATERSNITQHDRIWEDTNNINITPDNMQDDSNYIYLPWEDPHKPYWVLADNRKIPCTQEQWDPEKTKLFNAELDKQAELFPYKEPLFLLAVFLPAD